MHIINRLYQAEYDFPPVEQPPAMEYMIATIPRSGSTYFALELWRTGLLGAPMEYVNPPYISILKQRLGQDMDMLSYWKEVQKIRTSPNGVFGYKMFIGNYVQSEQDYPEVLQKIAPNKVIFLTRRDLVGQAVSLTRAVQSKAWFHGVDLHDQPKYSFQDIHRGVGQITMEVEAWKDIFQLTDTEPLPVYYEDLLADREGTMARVREYLGVAADPLAVLDLPNIEMQRTSESTHWAKRFASENASGVPAGLEGTDAAAHT